MATEPEATTADPPEHAAERALSGRDGDRSSQVAPPRPTSITRGRRLKAWWRKEARPFWRDVQWIAVGIGAAVALVLGYLGFDEHLDEAGESASFADTIYRSLQLFSLSAGDVDPPVPATLQVARFLAPAVAVYAAIAAVAALLREQLQLLRVRFLRDHVVVCGLGGRGLLLAKGFNARGDRVVAIESDDEARGIGECREEGVIVLIGDATDRTMLRKARVDRAKHLVVVAREDAVNAEAAADVPDVIRNQRRRRVARLWAWTRQRVLRRRPGVTTAFVHVIDPNLCQLLRQRELASPKEGFYRVEFFSVYEIAARVVVSEYPVAPAGSGGGEAPHRIVVVGLGQLGEALVLHAAKAWRAVGRESGRRLSITVVDQAAARKCEALGLRYPQLDKACELVAREMNIKDPDFHRARFLEDGGVVASVVHVCVDDDALGLRAAQALLPKARAHGVPIVVRMGQRAGLATLLGADAGERKSLRVFPLLDRTCAPELLLDGTRELLARIIHEDYLRHQRARGETREKKPSVVEWEELEETFKESNRRQADHIGVKLAAIGCGIEPLTDWDAKLIELSRDEVELLAEMEHERWVQEREDDGWIWGPERDDDKKIHPDLVPWEQLKEDVRDYDRRTVRGLPAFLAQAGFRVYRLAEDRSA